MQMCKECKSMRRRARPGNARLCGHGAPYDSLVYCDECARRLNLCAGCGLKLSKSSKKRAK